MREYWLDPPEPKVWGYCDRCDGELQEGSNQQVWTDGYRLVCECCLDGDEAEYLRKVV